MVSLPSNRNPKTKVIEESQEFGNERMLCEHELREVIVIFLSVVIGNLDHKRIVSLCVTLILNIPAHNKYIGQSPSNLHIS